MAKKDTSTEEETKEKVNQPAGAAVVEENNVLPSREVLAHQWQKDSASINTNTLAGYSIGQESIFDKLKTPEEEPEKEQEKVSEAEYERRTKLDVSDPKYINPSLDHVAKGK